MSLRDNGARVRLLGSEDQRISRNAAQLGPQLAVETSKTAVLDAEQVTSIANAMGMSR